MFLLLSILDLIVLYFLSRLITRALSRLIHTKTRKLHLTVKIFSFLLFPGTFLHELSHYVIAHVLGVKTYDFVLLPKLEENTVRLGSVTMAKSDVLRRTFIGIAPLVAGLASIFFCFWLITRGSGYVFWQLGLAGLFTFQISNTMFPSKADIEGSVPLFVILFCVLLAPFFFFGDSLVEAVYVFGSSTYLKTALYYFSVIIAIDIAVFTLLRVILHRR